MVAQEINEVVALAKKYDAEKFLQTVTVQYGDNFDMETIKLPTLTLSQFYGLSIKVCEQFQNSFENIGLLLPVNFNHPHYGNSNVIVQFQGFINSIEPATINLNNAEAHLLWLSLYQISFGFYNDFSEKSTVDLFDKNSHLAANLLITEKSILNQKREVSAMFDSLKIEQETIQKFVELKKEELNQIKENLSISTSQTNEVNRLFVDATKVNEQIIGLLKIQDENKIKVDKLIEEFGIQYKNINDEITSNSIAIEERIESFNIAAAKSNEYLAFIESKKAFFDERINYLQDLIGREVGVSLFETFKQRKIELKKSVNLWTLLVFCMALVTVGWIFVLFGEFAADPSKGMAIVQTNSIWWGILQ